MGEQTVEDLVAWLEATAVYARENIAVALSPLPLGAGLRQAAAALQRLAGENERLRVALAKVTAPIDWQDIRLAAGEGRLSLNAVLAAANVVVSSRAPAALSRQEPVDGR